MGACEFFVTARGEDVEESFDRVVRQAQYEEGHGGYTGTIAEKGSYVVVAREPLGETEAHALAERLLADEDPRVDDKWGPAGAIPCKNKDGKMVGWLFFGRASS